ncbi:hypothetical protein A8C75_10795 [Marinobacterium aestuarii]|uniref:HTH gntR-type domain-containing protein n=1 Tax=Marinobacterium aestuarii TaxID=1821621 RepID=A0A1A9EYC0_9GAMM|nr:UTRA domain-containing protein [Marinobacterium aestuarii]ANG62926.1 hypothetical protein A8C75_10795 [Marinobacterium aestuarii]
MASLNPVTAFDVAQDLQQGIARGLSVPGARLESERSISQRLGTSRVTVREGLKLLEAEGVIYRSNRRGWYLTPARILYDPSRSAFFMDLLAGQGVTPFSRVLDQQTINADAPLAAQMGVSPGEPLLFLSRVRGAEDRPLCLDQVWLRSALLPGIAERNLEPSVSAVLREHYGQDYSRQTLNIRASTLTSAQAETLLAPVGYSCIRIDRLVRDGAGQVVECDTEIWRHEALQLSMDISPGH